MLGKLSEFNKVTLVSIRGHQGIPGNGEADRLTKEGAAEFSSNQFTAIPFSVGRKLIKQQLELGHQTRCTACAGYRQSKMLMRYPLPSRADELLAISKLRLRVAAGLLTGHTGLRAHLYKPGHRERQECRLCGYDKEDNVHTVCDCPVLACKSCRIWGSMFLKPEDLEKARMGSLLSLVANTGLGSLSLLTS
jgi:hypothetical protein